MLFGLQNVACASAAQLEHFHVSDEGILGTWFSNGPKGAIALCTSEFLMVVWTRLSPRDVFEMHTLTRPLQEPKSSTLDSAPIY